MTVPASTRRSGPFLTNGSVTAFTFDFKVFTTADPRVVLTEIAEGTETDLVLNDDYTIVLNADQDNNPGGVVTTDATYATGYKITIVGDIPFEQNTDIQNAGGFLPEVIENALDYITVLVQQLKELNTRVFALSVSSGVSPVLPPPVGGNAIVWNADGTALINVPLQAGTSLIDLSANSGSNLIGFIQSGSNTVSRTSQDKAREIKSVSDYTTTADALVNITTRGSVFVERGASITPAGATGKDVGYFFIDGGDADNILQQDGTRGGLYSDYDCKANFIMAVHIDADQSAVSGGGFRDGLFINVIDDDTVNYTAIGNKVTHGLRSFVQGKHNGTAYQSIYKDLVGAYFSAAGNVQWSARGVSAITADAWQFGVGIASNEFAINNPASGAGGQGQSVSGAAVDAIVRFDYADEDGSHFAYGAVIENSGKRITAGIMLFSNTSRGYSGHFKHLLYAADAITTGSAIVMPQSASGDVGTIIAYDLNDYSYFDRTNNRFNWINGGALIASMTPNGLALGSATTTGTWLLIEASTTSKSHLRMFQGVAPSSPADGDLWYNGTNLKFQNGATLRTISWV